jgi:hypothetical protein
VALTDGWSEDHGFSEDELDDGLASGRLLPITALAPETERGWMQGFAESLEDGWARDSLFDALAGPEPTRSFVEALGRFPRERLAWLECLRGRRSAVVRAWLEANDVSAVEDPEYEPGRRQTAGS